MYKYILRTIPRTTLIKVSLQLNSLTDLFFSGKKFYDPIINKHYKYFLPYGRSKATFRKNALSPGSLSLERHRLMWLILQRHTNFFQSEKSKSVLHVAPEQCFYKKFKSLTHLDYITADLESPIADVKMDLHEIPFEDNHFDVIFCNHVLEHVANDIQCMSELYRVMKIGGWGIFQVPINTNNAHTLEEEFINTPSLREKYYFQKDHMRLYGMDYPERMRSVGFEVEMVNLYEIISDEEWKKCMLEDEPFFIFYKK